VANCTHARWDVLTGSDPQQLRAVRTVAKNGFETAISLESKAGYVAMRALDRRGNVLGVSRAAKLTG
jgi:hypothetical protein